MTAVRTSSRTQRIGFRGIKKTTDESVLDWDYTPEMFNYRIENGTLTGGLGFSDAQGFAANGSGARRDYPALPSGVFVEDIFHYRRRASGAYDDRIVIRSSSGALYYTSVFLQDTWHAVEGYTLSSGASAVSYNYGGKDVLLMCSPDSAFAVLDDGTVKEVLTAPRFSSVTVHNERVYGTLNGENNQLWFSDDFDPENWNVSGDEAGYISFADECGDALAAVSFLGYLYIFREHGIYRLTAYGDQSEFVLKKLFTATGMIYKRTITLCGDRIMFLTDEGVYAFDGYDAAPAVPELPKLTSFKNCVGAYYDGAYWLACMTNIGELAQGLYVNNALVRYDIATGDMCMMAGQNFVALCALRSHGASDLLCSVHFADSCKLGSFSENGRVFGTATQKIYRTPYGDLSSSAYKTVRDVTLTTKYALEVRVVTDGEIHSYPLAASDEPQTVFVGKSGKKIGLELRSASGLCFVTQPVVRLDVTRQ